jgi:hypothetical protein
LEGEVIEACLASLSRFLPGEEINGLGEITDHSEIPDDVELRDDDDVTGVTVSVDPSVSVRAERSLARLREREKISTFRY